MRKHKFKSGMSLVELVIVIGLLGVLFAAIYMFFVKGTEQFHFIRQQNTLSTTGKLVLEQISDEVVWAGYMPRGGWDDDDWKPVEVASTTSFQFYADYEGDGDGSLTGSDHRNIFCDTDNHLHITDDDVKDRVVGIDIVNLEFDYLDRLGNLLTKPLDEVARKQVRHLKIKITLQSTYMGDVYQTIMQTMVTPRNLGLSHGFDPLFYYDEYSSLGIVVNVAGSKDDYQPTAHQRALLDQLEDWRIQCVEIADDEIKDFNFAGPGVDILILRDMPGAASHASLSTELNAVPVPIIILDPNDAEMIFGLGTNAAYVSGGACSMAIIEPLHPIHNNISGDPFDIYKTSSSANVVTTIDPDLANGVSLKTAFNPGLLSGVSVLNEDSLEARRIHYCAPDFANYNANGLRFLYNVIGWTVPTASPPELGDKVELESFEGSAPNTGQLTFWSDDLESTSGGGSSLPDSVPLYTDFSNSTRGGLNWIYKSTGEGRIRRDPVNNYLIMDRGPGIVGGYDTNVAMTTIDLSAYNPRIDNIYLKVDVLTGRWEKVDRDDGVYVVMDSSGSGSVAVLADENFEGTLSSNVEFSLTAYGRHRVHSPGWWSGTATNTFATLDNQNVTGTNKGSARMLFTLDTSKLSDGTPITVTYRFTDHKDYSNGYTSGNPKKGDYIAWSTSKNTDTPVNGSQNFNPGGATDGEWSLRTYTFTPPGTMPSEVYLIFNNWNSYPANSAVEKNGVSIDDVKVTAPLGSGMPTLRRVGNFVWAQGWQTSYTDLCSAHFSTAKPFANFPIALGQGGTGSHSVHGIMWKDLEIGHLVISSHSNEPAGWKHWGSIAPKQDNWIAEKIGENHIWTLHSINPNTYDPHAYCTLLSPVISVPAGAVDPKFIFEHSIDFRRDDVAKLIVTDNGGITWSYLQNVSAYNGFDYNSRPCFVGKIPWSTVEVPLNSFVGKNVQIGFEFEASSHDDVGAGWMLDNFKATAIMPGTPIYAIGFKQPANTGSWNFDAVDVWLGGVTIDTFAADGEMDKALLSNFGTHALSQPASGNWAVITLDKPFFLAPGQNLAVKLEMNQTSTTSNNLWSAIASTGAVRSAVAGNADPTHLVRGKELPALMIDTGAGGKIYVEDPVGAVSSYTVPLAFGAAFSDFEAIYTARELGISGQVLWTHGGVADDWEFGVPLFIAPSIDPALRKENENSIAGNDLTDDGYYAPSQASWLCSEPYPMLAMVSYDSISVKYDRCLRIASDDLAWVQIAFSDTATIPQSPGDWTELERYNYSDDHWTEQVLDITGAFKSAEAAGKKYYFIRFVIDSSLSQQKGGWNIDNVGFYGRKAGV